MAAPWVHIIGAGVSGLSLAAELARHEKLPGDVVVSDPNLDRPRSQTFSFWHTQALKKKLQPEKSWRRWSFTEGNAGLMHDGERYHYGMVSGERFRQRAFEQINAHPQIHLQQTCVQRAPVASYLFDSRPPRLEDFKIKQSFVGIEVELTTPHYQDYVSLMEEMVCIDHGLQFRYVLPISPTRFMVEYTRFTQSVSDLDELDRLGRSWLEREFAGRYQVIREERAHIPMGLLPIEEHWGIPIGTRAGMARDATGYGFVEMHLWAERAAAQMMKGEPLSQFRAPMLRSWMDRCLLRIIEHKPERLPEIFMRLATYASGDQFARFMTSCKYSDAFAMICRAPKLPFLYSAIGKTQWI